MRVVLFGSGSPLSLAALEAIAERVVAVVVPGEGKIRGPRSAWRALAVRRARRDLVRAARRRNLPLLRDRRVPSADLAADLRRLQPDLACVATFPRLLDAATLAAPRRGTLGLHPSLLPRHRGPSPLFWTYFEDDAEAGVTVHWLDADEDTGDVVLQERVPLPRGRPAADLYLEIARRGAALLARAVAEVEAGTAARVPQDPSRATREPAPEKADWGIDFATWSAERVWHFLRGVGGIGFERMGHDVTGVRGYRLEARPGIPGEIERAASGWRLVCRDGFVELDKAPLLRRALGAVRRLGGWGRRRPAGSSPRRRAAAEPTGTRSSA